VLEAPISSFTQLAATVRRLTASHPLDGHWRVDRLSGVLPPFGVRKRIQHGRGWTLVGPVPLASFHVRGGTLVYRRLPVRDELERQADGTWLGRGLLWGREFCRFRLIEVSRPGL
jgi:hypothetical protein